MEKVISDCVGCGLQPCHHCKRTIEVCDCCKNEADELIEVGFDNCEGESWCYDCLLDFITNDPNEVANYLWNTK